MLWNYDTNIIICLKTKNCSEYIEKRRSFLLLNTSYALFNYDFLILIIRPARFILMHYAHVRRVMYLCGISSSSHRISQYHSARRNAHGRTAASRLCSSIFYSELCITASRRFTVWNTMPPYFNTCIAFLDIICITRGVKGTRFANRSSTAKLVSRPTYRLWR